MSYFNMVCDCCGREVYGCNIVNGMKFCAKCYQETFGETDKDKQIAELQKQLEEKEEEIEDLKRKVNCYVDYVKNTDMRIELDSFIVKELQDKLKSQPAEIVKKIKEQIFNHFNVNNMEEYESLSLLDSLFTADAVTDMLDDILKEYQK